MEMIEIFNALIKKGHSIHWDIYGDGSLKYDILKKKNKTTRVGQ
ncbi:hypothetical protein ACVTMZ_15970 [Escherichia coli]